MRLDGQLATGSFVAGNSFSIADITAFVSIEYAGWLKIKPDVEHVHLQRWFAEVRQRPSAGA